MTGPFTCRRSLPDNTGRSGHVYTMHCRREAGHEGDCIPGWLGAIAAMDRFYQSAGGSFTNMKELHEKQVAYERKTGKNAGDFSEFYS